MSNDVRDLNKNNPLFSRMKFGNIFKQIIGLINQLRSGSVAYTRLISGIPALQEGTSTTTSSRMNNAVRFQLNGQEYYAPAAEAVLDGAATDITAAKFGAWRFELSAAGALTSTAADATGMAFESAQLALLELANKALTPNTLVVGYLVIEATGAGFTIGTDLPVTSDANVTAATYYDEFGNSGIVAALASLAVSATPEQVAVGASTVKINGIQLAEISANATLAFPVADTITTLTYGAWLVVSDLAGTDYTLVSADGKSEAALMAYADYAAADTALDSLAARLPGLFVVVGRVILQNGVKAPWTAITDDITDGSDVVESRFQVTAAGTGLEVISATAVNEISGAIGD